MGHVYDSTIRGYLWELSGLGIDVPGTEAAQRLSCTAIEGCGLSKGQPADEGQDQIKIATKAS